MLGLDGVDVIVWEADAVKVSDIAPEFQLQAMLQWVKAGGHLIISVATQGQEFLKADSKMPEHQHPQEQIVHILSGRMTVFANGGAHELQAGDSYYLASNVPHRVETPEDTRVLDTFSPPHHEYIALDEEARQQ